MSNVSTIQGTALSGPISSRALAYMQEHKAKLQSELAGGITGGFGVIGYKGKVWSIRYQGEQQNIMRQSAEGNFQEAVPAIPLVIIAATPHITKTWYEQGYTEGSNAPPDCASSNGIAPDPASPKRQNDLCANCRWNQFGSRISQDGKGRGKACADSKRLAAVPSNDILNETYGGPMLLRVPAASLSELQKYSGELERSGYPFFAVGTWVRFDGDDAYPKMLFSPQRPLTDDEFDIIVKYRESDQVKRILNAGEFSMVAGTEAAPPAAPQFSDTPPAPTPPAPTQSAPQTAQAAPQAASPPPVATQAPAPVQTAPAPTQAPGVAQADGDFTNYLDNLMAGA